MPSSTEVSQELESSSLPSPTSRFHVTSRCRIRVSQGPGTLRANVVRNHDIRYRVDPVQDESKKRRVALFVL
jgi:hypothetical protein